MCFNLNENVFKVNRYTYRSSHMNPMLTTNQKATRDTQKLQRKEHKQTTRKSSKHKGRNERKKKRTKKNYLNDWKTGNKW